MRSPLFKMIIFTAGPPNTTFHETRWPFVAFPINDYMTLRNAESCFNNQYFTQASRGNYASIQQGRIYPFAVMEPHMTFHDIKELIRSLNREFQAQVPDKSYIEIYEEMCEKYDGRILKVTLFHQLVDL